MNKKWMIVIISFLLLVVLIGVGGKVYMDKRAEQKEAEKIEAERMSVEALKNTFEDIKSVEFEKSAYNVMTGSYGMSDKMMEQEKKTVSFSYNYSKNTPNEISSYLLEDEEVQSEGTTTNKVQVIFSNKEEDKI